MAKVTAAATLHTKHASVDGVTGMIFAADYNDPRNKEWSKYTPVLSINMAVLDDVADEFQAGETYLVSFELKP